MTQHVRRNRWGHIGLALPALVIGVGFFLWPMASIIGTGLGQDPGALWDTLGDRGLWGVAWFTLWQATLSTVVTLAIGLPLAHVIARYRFPGRGLLRTIVTIPFVLPTIVVALAFLTLIGPGGVLGLDLSGTAVAIIAAHVFFNVAVVVRTVGALWSHIDPRMEHAARTLGARRLRVMRTVTLPLLRPAILAAGAIVFLFSFTSFGVVILLGAPRLATIEVEIYRSAIRLFDLPTAASLALVQLVAVSAVLWWYARVQERASVTQHLLPRRAVLQRPRGRQRWAVAAIATLGAALVLVPLGSILSRALSPQRGFGLDTMRSLSRVDPSLLEPGVAMTNSLAYACVATLIALGVGLPAAALVVSRRGGAGRWIDPLLMLPIGSSAVTLGLGLIVGLDAPFDLRSWWGLVPVAHAIVAIPFVVRMTTPILRSIGPRLRAAAATLGASPKTAWRTVDLPIITPAALAAAGFAFVISLGEFGATLFVARTGGQTMTLAIFRLLGRPGSINLSAALAMSVLLISVSGAVVALLERARVPGIGSF